MATVFDVFAEVSYTFLSISRGNVYGNRITGRRELKGVFKLKNGMTSTNNMELMDADATLHAHPEDFAQEEINSLIGQGVEVNGTQYSIEGISAGTNFDNGVIEHLYMRLQKADFVEADNGRK